MPASNQLPTNNKTSQQGHVPAKTSRTPHQQDSLFPFPPWNFAPLVIVDNLSSSIYRDTIGFSTPPKRLAVIIVLYIRRINPNYTQRLITIATIQPSNKINDFTAAITATPKKNISVFNGFTIRVLEYLGNSMTSQYTATFKYFTNKNKKYIVLCTVIYIALLLTRSNHYTIQNFFITGCSQ